VLAEVLHPLLLERAVVLGRLDEVEEALDRALEALLERGVREPPVAPNASCAWASENMSG
jgi:hypothetical protein